MEEKKNSSSIGFISVFLGLLWIIVAKLFISFLGENTANIFVTQTTGLTILGIITGIIYGKNSGNKIWSLFPTIFWPLSELGTSFEGVVYSVWLSIISILLINQGITIGEKIKRTQKSDAIHGC